MIRRLVGGALLLLSLGLGCATREPEPTVVEPTMAPARTLQHEVVPPLPPTPTVTLSDRTGTPIEVRVGLATDLETLDVTCCRTLSSLEGERTLVPGPSEVAVVRPAASVRAGGSYRVQVAALESRAQAEILASRLVAAGAMPADVVFDAASGLFRVRAGRQPERARAEALREALVPELVETGFVVHEGSAVENPGFDVALGGRSIRWPGRWLAVSEEGGTVEVFGTRYRGRLLVYLNDRGLLNVINEVDLESYLKGVVPREMGPELYPAPEAIKAQAVAARTYTVKNLAGFETEGYDLCATPRCQVYGGVESEHPVASRAVDATAGIVLLFAGEPIEALYSATCGGHTEDVAVVFPEKAELDYLRGVPCIEGPSTRLGSDLSAGTPFPGPLVWRLYPGPGGTPVEVFAQRALALARSAGLAPPPIAVSSFDREEVEAYLEASFGRALAARRFVAGPADSTGDAAGDFGSALAGLDLHRAEARDELLYRLAVRLGLIEERDVAFLAFDGHLVVRGAEGTESLPVGDRLATFRARGDQVVAEHLSLAPGDPMRLLVSRGDVVAVVQAVASDVPWKRPSPWAAWTRFRTDAELEASVSTRYPGFRLASLEVSGHGVSGRVGELHLVDQNGDEELVEGLAVRWTLDLPDTLFTLRRSSREGSDGWLFEGRGWGHGVGMCQVGAFGMARRGRRFDEILQHYYTAVELGRVEAAIERVHQEIRLSNLSGEH